MQRLGRPGPVAEEPALIMDVNELLRYSVERGASDLHLKVGNVPFIRVDGALEPTRFETLSAEDTESFTKVLMSEQRQAAFVNTSEAHELSAAVRA